MIIFDNFHIKILVSIDLSDEQGNLKFLSNSLDSYGTEHLSERNSYILIKIQSKYRIIVV